MSQAKDVATEEPNLFNAELATEEPDLFNAELKKKKKKKVVDVEEIDALLQESTVGDEDVFSGKKKKKKPVEAQATETSIEAEAVVESDYSMLLARFYKLIREQNPELAGEKKKYTIVPPQVVREGSKKTAFTNYIDICTRMRRSPEHVVQYLMTEMGTTGSVDGNQRLVIKGRFQQKQVENLLKKYIVEYVTCKTCKSADTNFVRENRLVFVQCESCGSTRTVSAIKTGFLAQTTKRAAQRAAT